MQLRLRQDLIDARNNNQSPLPPMKILMLEHDPPVITITKKQKAADHLLASPQHLNKLGIQLKQTDRGGDITYHGPGQLIAYPILDLKRLHLGVHDYMHTLEQLIINTLARFDIKGERDPNATGVWVRLDPAPDNPTTPHPSSSPPTAKICAMGVRISRWITMHGLALNITTDLSHFETIIPCGLTGRTVTSIKQILTQRHKNIPTVSEVQNILTQEFHTMVSKQLNG